MSPMLSQIGNPTQARLGLARSGQKKPRHGASATSHAPSWPPKTTGTRRYYILISHIIGRDTADNHIFNRVRIERAIANSLGCGLFSPYHKTTLKSKLKVDSLKISPSQLITLLADHAKAVLEGAQVAIVIDDLRILMEIEENCLHLSTQKLLNVGAMMIIIHPASGPMPMVTLFKSSDTLF